MFGELLVGQKSRFLMFCQVSYRSHTFLLLILKLISYSVQTRIFVCYFANKANKEFIKRHFMFYWNRHLYVNANEWKSTNLMWYLYRKIFKFYFIFFFHIFKELVVTHIYNLLLIKWSFNVYLTLLKSSCPGSKILIIDFYYKNIILVKLKYFIS